MGEYILDDKAAADLISIWDYTVDVWSENQAIIYYDMLLDHCELIADNPNLGKSYDGVVKNLRGYRAGRHIIFFMAADGDRVLIVRILHGQMDLKNRIDE